MLTPLAHSPGGGATLCVRARSREARDESAIDVTLLRARLHDLLSEDELRVVSLRYGLSGEKPLSVAKIAAAQDVSPYCIRAMNDKALRKLRMTLREQEVFML